ncbi:MAG: hypothetical protein WC223_03890 [Bacteroidales bacterium]|jgi:hypothetical protein
MKKTIALIALTTFILGKANSQNVQRVNIALNPSYIKLFDDKKISCLGFGTALNYTVSKDNKTFASAKYNYYLPSKFSYQPTLFNNNNSNLDQVDLAGTAKLFQFSFALQRYFIGEYQYDFSVYGSLAYNFIKGTYTYNLKTPDTNLDYSFVDGTKEKLNGKGLSIGAGCEKKFGAFYAFADVTYNLNFNKASSISNTFDYPNEGTKIPSYINLLLGVKIALF